MTPSTAIVEIPLWPEKQQQQEEEEVRIRSHCCTPNTGTLRRKNSQGELQHSRVLADINNKIFEPYLAAIHRIFISVKRWGGGADKHHAHSRTVLFNSSKQKTPKKIKKNN
jgi:hypothetical protein